MKLEAATIEELFIAAGDKGDDLREIDRMITSIAPDQKRQLFAGSSITMVGYGEMPWQSASDGGVWPVIGMTAQKHYISLYVAAIRDGVTLAEFYRDRLGTTNNGKGCIRFRRLEVVDHDMLADAIRDAFDWASVQAEQFGRDCARPDD